MESGEWYREKEEAQYAYEHDLIDRDIYELRTKTAIGMIYKCGNAKDKKSAKKNGRSSWI